MNNYRMGRPMEAIKGTVVKARIDCETVDKLDYCARHSGKSKSEIIRRGIEKAHEEIRGEEAK